MSMTPTTEEAKTKGQEPMVDRAIMAALSSISIEDEVESYEFRADEGDHTPDEDEKALLIDFAHGLMGRVQEVIRPLVAPSSPGVPDSVRAAFLAAELHECWVNGDTADVMTTPYPGCGNFSQVVARCATGELWRKRAVAIAEALNFVRTLISGHPAGQSATPETDPNLLYWIESSTERLCKLYPEAADSIAEFRDELLGLMDGGPAGQGAELSSRIYKVLRDYGMSNMMDQDDGGAYPLVDLCTPDCRPINQGEDELRLIADEIAYALAPDSTRTGQVEAETPEWLVEFVRTSAHTAQFHALPGGEYRKTAERASAWANDLQARRAEMLRTASECEDAHPGSGAWRRGVAQGIAEALASEAPASAELNALRDALHLTRATADDLASASLEEGDNKAAGALQSISGYISDRLAVLAARPAAPEAQGVERVRHVKRGTEYEVLGEAEAQVSTVGGRVLGDYDKLTVYRGSDGKLWCRFTDEMRDGRFVPASSGQESAR